MHGNERDHTLRERDKLEAPFVTRSVLKLPVSTDFAGFHRFSINLPDLRLTETTRPLLEAKLLEAVEKADRILG